MPLATRAKLRLCILGMAAFFVMAGIILFFTAWFSLLLLVCILINNPNLNVVLVLSPSLDIDGNEVCCEVVGTLLSPVLVINTILAGICVLTWLATVVFIRRGRRIARRLIMWALAGV